MPERYLDHDGWMEELNDEAAEQAEESYVQKKPPVGEATWSLQHRCTRWSKHEPPFNRPYPCEGCYSLFQTNVVVPYAPRVPFTTLHEGSYLDKEHGDVDG